MGSFWSKLLEAGIMMGTDGRLGREGAEVLAQCSPCSLWKAGVPHTSSFLPVQFLLLL